MYGGKQRLKHTLNRDSLPAIPLISKLKENTTAMERRHAHYGDGDGEISCCFDIMCSNHAKLDIDYQVF